MEPVLKTNKRMPVATMLDPKIVMPAIGAAFAKLHPRAMVKNPVMFVVEIVAALTTVIFLRDLVTGGANLAFTFQIILWLWFTVLFANFAEAVAEGRGKAQADTLRKTRTESQAKLLSGSDGNYRLVPGTSLKVGNIVLVEAGDNIPSDGEVIEGVACQRGGDHGRIRACDPRVRRRSLGGHRRHQGSFRLGHRAHLFQSWRDLP